MLVEDSNIARKMELKALQILGYQNVVVAEDGDIAVEKLQSEEGVGLIISDWNMPNRDGLELLKWVRADAKCQKIPFIMATARGEKSQVTAAQEAGVSNFVTKPFAPNDLKEVIEETFVSGGTMATAAPREPQVAANGKLKLHVAHLQITDHLILGVLKELLQGGRLQAKNFELTTHCMTSWSALQGSLEKGKLDGAFALAPIAMDLFGFGIPIKLVLFAHRNGSIAVRSHADASNEDMQASFLGKTFYIPHELSIHHMLAHMFLQKIGLTPGFKGKGECDVFFEVVPPIKMPELMATNPEACGFLVAEPLGTKAIADGSADLMFLSGELWETHPCCVVTMRDEVIAGYPEAVQEFTDLLVEAGRFVQEKPELAAEIAVKFLDPTGELKLKVPVLKNVLKESAGIKTNDLYPVASDLDTIQQYMVNTMGVGSIIDVNQFIDTRFAKNSCHGTGNQQSHLHDPALVLEKIRERQRSGGSKSALNIEGSYLLFNLARREYGIDILGVKEIISSPHIRAMPNFPHYIPGLIDFRGRVIPILDVRLRLGMLAIPITPEHKVIVVENRQGSNINFIGLLVDSVTHVIDVTMDNIADASGYRARIETKHMLAFAKMKDDIKILLDTRAMCEDIAL